MAHTLTSKGQVTIPKEYRDRLGLGPGDKLEFALNAHGELVVRREGVESAFGKRQAEIRKQLEKIRGSATTGLSTAEIMRLTRGRRM
jgi:AbrB family looped-hinge helix DNA binding protein